MEKAAVLEMVGPSVNTIVINMLHVQIHLEVLLVLAIMAGKV